MSDPRPPRLALVLIDLQNSYFEFPELEKEKDRLLARANELVAVARDAGRPVVLVRTEHERDRSTWTLNMLEDEQGFAFPGTEQAAFLDGLDVEGGIEVTKTRDSAFHDTRLAEVLEDAGATHVLLAGVSTHSCVSQTATAAFAHDLHVAIDRDAIASDDTELSAAMLDFLGDEMRQSILDHARALTLLRDGPAAS